MGPSGYPDPQRCTVFGADEAVAFRYDRVENLFVNGVLTGAPFQSESTTDIRIEGPTVGIALSVPFARSFGVYANYAHGFMDVDINQSGLERDFDADYDLAELGVSYTHGTKDFVPFVPLSAATVYAGYRWQHIETDFEEFGADDRTDTTRGFAVGVNLTF